MPRSKLFLQPGHTTWLFVLMTLAGCSSGPTGLDAAGEQALRDDLSKVATAEQDQRRRSTGMTSAAAPAGPNFHPEEGNRR